MTRIVRSVCFNTGLLQTMAMHNPQVHQLIISLPIKNVIILITYIYIKTWLFRAVPHFQTLLNAYLCVVPNLNLRANHQRSHPKQQVTGNSPIGTALRLRLVENQLQNVISQLNAGFPTSYHWLKSSATTWG